MKAKEEAERLVGNFESTIRACVNTFQASFPEGAKQCALILVEEIRRELLAQYNKHYSEDAQLEIGYWCNSEECKFWTEVNKEIKKL